MKTCLKILLPILVIAATTGCHTIKLTLPGGAGGKVTSFGRQSSFQKLSLDTNGVLTVEGYNNDEVTGLGMAIGALRDLAAKTSTGGIAP